MNANYYSTGRQAEDAMAVLARWISGNRKIQVQYHNGSAIDADIFKGGIRIPRMSCASGVTQEALMLLRGRVYHESGHIDESTDVTKAEYPKGALHAIWNALEDRRMETSLSRKHDGAKVVFEWNTQFYNKEIASKITSGKTDAPLWEALCAMMFMVDGMRPAWVATPKAQAYIDAAYNKFCEVKTCKDVRESLELAKKVYELLKDVNEQWKNENPQEEQKQEPQQQEPQQQEQEQDGGEGEQGEPQSGGSKDFDDYENEKPQNGGKGDENDEKSEDKDSDEKDSSSKGSEKNGEKNEDKSEDKNGDADGDNGDEDGKGKGDADDADGDDADGDDADETDVETDGDGKGNGSGDTDDTDEDTKNDEQPGGTNPGKVIPGDSPYSMQDDDPTSGMGRQDDRNLDEEIDGVSQEQIINEELEKYFKDLDPADTEYLSRRELDEHIVPPSRPEDRTEYVEQYKEISVMVATMTHTLEQSLRSLAKSRKRPYLRHGKIDHKRLVAIAKGLSKEVFYKNQEGMTLDVAVELVIDESGSMGNYMQVRLLAMAIGEALNAIGVPFEIMGTTTKYSSGDYRMEPLNGFDRTNPIRYNHYKLFNEPWGQVRQRITNTGAHVHNIDGEAVEYAAFRLETRRETRKIVFSLSDGEPCAGHSNDKKMATNLKRVCDKARKNGIEVYGAGIGTRGPEYLYGGKWFLYLESAEKMGAEFVKKFADVVTAGRVRVS